MRRERKRETDVQVDPRPKYIVVVRAAFGFDNATQVAKFVRAWGNRTAKLPHERRLEGSSIDVHRRKSPNSAK
jgi:hypothetical protein